MTRLCCGRVILFSPQVVNKPLIVHESSFGRKCPVGVLLANSSLRRGGHPTEFLVELSRAEEHAAFVRVLPHLLVSLEDVFGHGLVWSRSPPSCERFVPYPHPIRGDGPHKR